MIAKAQFTIKDMNDIWPSPVPPVAIPPVGFMWRNTSVNPNELLGWTGKGTDVAREYSASKNGASVLIEDLSDNRALGVTVKTVASQVNGTPSPTAPLAISGKTSVKAVRTGKNIPKPGTTVTSNGVTFTVAADGTITINGTCTAAAGTPVAASFLQGFYLNGQFTLSANNDMAYGSDLQLRLLQASGTSVVSPNTNFSINTVGAKMTFNSLEPVYLWLRGSCCWRDHL